MVREDARPGSPAPAGDRPAAKVSGWVPPHPRGQTLNDDDVRYVYYGSPAPAGIDR